MLDISIVRRIAALRQHGKIVFTNGIFDLLHLGHIEILGFAANHGFVIVGVNSDSSAFYLKRRYPIYSEFNRVRMVSHIKGVEYVVIFDEPTPILLIEQIRPDIIVKGGDYKPEDVAGKEFIESYGGQVVIFPRYGDYSTSNLIAKIRGS